MFLADLVASYLFEKSRALINLITYHSIYQYDSLLVVKVNKSVKEIKYWLEGFQKTVNKAGLFQPQMKKLPIGYPNYPLKGLN